MMASPAVPDEPSSTSSSTSTTGDPTSTTGAVDDHTSRASTVLGCAAIPASKSDIRCQYETDCKGGRRPAGLCSEGRSGGADPTARWFAEVAHLEAASVPAFERLAAELREHDAPAELIAAALRAAVDEARHADLLGAIAKRLGGRPSPVELAPVQGRSLVELALENAVEGCVGETWAALLAAHQARAAEDPEIRACMIEVAADEAAHADLAWAIDAWIAPRLTADERTRVLTARSQAARALRDPPPRDEALERRAGLPASDLARRLWQGLDRELWSAAA
ncbi:ferritin-like domain-containing protein [Nannocystis pusilla]|uniref:ferritin-like domain-containing protein n=1 Tax=Nannocystis pusilla TaxID=889268 RepID=UPI003B77BC30